MKQCFIKAKPIIEKLVKAGFEAYFVGGSVRDLLLNRPIGDIDIATSALPENVQSLFERTIPVGIEHGTVIVLLGEESYEVTTFRVEGAYLDYRHPSAVEFVSSLEQDLSRRDFTINAIAMDIDGVIIDPYLGAEDIKRKYIQTVGCPDERFSEDPLRMMRALRFLSQLDFTIDDTTKESIESNASLLTKISVERISAEFEKLLVGKVNEKSLFLLVELGVHNFLPGLVGKDKELFQFAENCVQKLDHIDEYWALLLKTLEIKDINSFSKEWKRSNEQVKMCKTLISGLETLENEKKLTPMFVYKYGKQASKSIVKLYSIVANEDLKRLTLDLQQIINDLPIQSRKELAITGSDLLSWFNQKGGPWVAQTLTQIEQAVITKQVRNEKSVIREWLTKCNRQYENNS